MCKPYFDRNYPPQEKIRLTVQGSGLCRLPALPLFTLFTVAKNCACNLHHFLPSRSFIRNTSLAPASSLESSWVVQRPLLCLMEQAKDLKLQKVAGSLPQLYIMLSAMADNFSNNFQ